jgi:hypothetical protein
MSCLEQRVEDENVQSEKNQRTEIEKVRGEKRKWWGSKGDKSFGSPTYPLPLHRYVCLPLHVMSGCCSGWRYRAQVTSSMSLGRQVLLIHGSSGPYIRRMGNQLLPGTVSSQLSSSPSGGLGAK